MHVGIVHRKSTITYNYCMYATRYSYSQFLSCSCTATAKVWATSDSLMSCRAPVGLESNHRVGISSWSSGRATFVHVKSSNCAPIHVDSVVILDVQETTSTHSCTLDA